MMFETPEDVAKEFRRRYRRLPDPDVWQWAIKKRLIRDAIDDPEEIDSVFDEILEVEALGRRPRGGPRERRKDLAPDQRAIALARILASEAARHPLVEAFRADCLQGTTIKPSGIKSWIEKKEHEQGKPARYVKRWERPSGARVDAPARKVYGFETRLEFGETSNAVFLTYPGGAVQVSPDSVLGRLKFSATALRHQFLWPEEEAVEFILSDTVPSPFFGSVSIRNTPSTPRISIEVDPRVPVHDVIRLYQWAREADAMKTRALSEMHADLAVFAFERNDGREWGRVLEEWNEKNPKNLYGELSNFIRDSRKAYKRITGSSLEWKRRRGGAGHRTRRRAKRRQALDV